MVSHETLVPKAEVLKGDFQPSTEEWLMSSKRDAVFQWTGATEDDFGLHLNGFKLAPRLKVTLNAKQVDDICQASLSSCS